LKIAGEEMPISKLSQLQANLEGMLDAGKELLGHLEMAKPKPHVLDDETVEHMRRVYLDQQQEIKPYQMLFKEWLQDKPTIEQRESLEKFNVAMRAVTDMHKQVFFLIDFFKEHTIDKIMEKDSAELAMDMLAGKVFPP